MANRKDSKGRVLQKGETQRKDGRYIYVYTDILGKRRQVYGATLQELRSKEQQVAVNMYNGVADTGITLDELFAQYMKARQNLSPATIVNYKKAYAYYIKELIGHHKIKALRSRHFVEFFAHLFEEKKLATRTVELANSVLSACFQFAVRNDMLAKSPVTGALHEAKISVGAKSKGKRHALTPSQTQNLLSYLATVDRKDYRLIKFMLLTGVRIGELSAIMEEDVDLAKNVVHINKSFNRFAGIKETKTEAGNRDIPLTEETRRLVEEEILWKHRTRFKYLPAPNLFVGVFGDMQRAASVNKRLHRYVDDYNKAAAKSSKPKELLPNITCHVLRHTFCARACESGMSVKTLQTLMGHTDIKTTMNIYAEVGIDFQKEEMARLTRHMCASGETTF